MSVAASIVTVGYFAAASLNWTAPRGEIVLAPVVATRASDSHRQSRIRRW